MKRIMVAGGGTGGHLFPGIAVVEELRRQLPDVDALFVGTERGIEARVLPARGERFVAMDVRPLVGRSKRELAQNVALMPRAALQALSIVRSFRPEVVLGLGGYASGPILMAAAAQGVKTALLEQNAYVGLANRMLAHVVGRAYLTYESTAMQFGERRARVLGNPVRRALVEAAYRAASDPVGTEARARKVLVLGGSQGARALNEQVPKALARAGLTRTGALSHVRVLHQTGAAMVDEVRGRYAELGIDADVTVFIEDVAGAYLDAALVVARAGATTLAELCAIGRPSVLVPYPFAAADHQRKNALALEQQGAAIALPEPDLGVVALADHVRTLLEHPDRRRAMSEAARRAGKPDAAAAIVDDLLEWLGYAAGRPPEPSGASEGSQVAGSDATPTRSSPNAVRRRAKVTRAELRIRSVGASIGAAR
jgi:UDP-N-acetylglucosamine--N-acetylmuramyl-(pentapeptide) pyrophosphoryl-undecaprenol N-acetylglucosamine transferase